MTHALDLIAKIERLEKEIKNNDKMFDEYSEAKQKEIDRLQLENKQLHSELNGKNLLIEQVLIDIVISEQTVTHLKKEYQRQMKIVEKLKQANEVVNNENLKLR